MEKIQNHFDENAEWDQILSDLNLAPSHLRRINPRAEAEAVERALIEDTEDWNSILASIEQEAQKFEAYAKSDSLLNQQRKIILDTQKRVEEDMQFKEVGIEQMLAKEEHWRAKREPRNAEQNHRRASEAKTMLRSSGNLNLSDAFYDQEKELDALGARSDGIAKTESLKDVKNVVEEVDTEDGGVLRTVVTKYHHDSSVHLDGSAIFPVITDCRNPQDIETVRPRDRNGPPPTSKGKSNKSKASRFPIDWNISSPESRQQNEKALPIQKHKRNWPLAPFVACTLVF